MSPVIISYFTKGSLYEKDAKQLQASCERFGLEYLIEGIEPFGKWHHHTCYKPTYILQKMETLKRPVLWIDADAEIVQKPTLFAGLDCDISLRVFDRFPPDHPSYAYTATLYLNHTPNTLALVRTWASAGDRAIQEGTFTVDQQLVGPLLANVRLFPLPIGYAATFEEDVPPAELFIVQYQASRLYRQIIDGDIPSLFFNQLSVDELRALIPRIQ